MPATGSAEAGIPVVGIDSNGAKIRAIRAGKSYIEDVPSDSVRAAVESGWLRVTSDCSALAEADKVNIGLVNEIALMCDRMGIDVWEVIDAAKTKPFGFMLFYPGPGIGGHCIPLDPFYLSWKAKQYGLESRFIELAGVIHGQMPHFVVGKVVDALNRFRKSVKGAKVLVLGVAYKKNISDVRESFALDILQLLGQTFEFFRGLPHDP